MKITIKAISDNIKDMEVLMNGFTVIQSINGYEEDILLKYRDFKSEHTSVTSYRIINGELNELKYQCNVEKESPKEYIWCPNNIFNYSSTILAYPKKDLARKIEFKKREMKLWNEFWEGLEVSTKNDTVYINGIPLEYMVSLIDKNMIAFLIFKHLILNGTIDENIIIGIKYPENTLHPINHPKFIKMLYLIHKYYKTKFLIFSRSHTIFHAIETFNTYYDCNPVNFYLFNNKDNIISLEDCTDKVDKMYEQLFKPIEYLRKIDKMNDE